MPIVNVDKIAATATALLESLEIAQARRVVNEDPALEAIEFGPLNEDSFPYRLELFLVERVGVAALVIEIVSDEVVVSQGAAGMSGLCALCAEVIQRSVIR